MGLTYPVLAAYTKYPTTPNQVDKKSGIINKKPGLFSIDLNTYSIIAEELGIKPVPESNRWYRHPFAYLTEVADDICISIIDFEDGFKSHIITYEEMKDVFSAIELDKIDNILDEREKADFLGQKRLTV